MNKQRIPPSRLHPVTFSGLLRSTLSLPLVLPGLLLISLSLLSACSRTPPSSPDLSLNPTSYELLSIVWSGPPPTAVGVAPSFGQAVYFTYDNNHLLTDYRRLDWGGDSLPSPNPPDTNVYTYHLEYTNGQVSKVDYNDGGIAFSQDEYYYNANGQVSSVREYHANIIGMTTDYQYDNRGNRILESRSSGGQLQVRLAYVFDNDNNLTSRTDSSLWPSQKQVARTVYAAHDDKVNFLKAINGFPGDGNVEFYPLTSPHNGTSQISYPAVNTGQPFGAGAQQTFSYEYNDEGLPTTIRTGAQVITLTYRRYRRPR